MDLDACIRKYALQNAVKFSGKANPGAVIGKIFAEHPESKNNAKEVSARIQAILKEIHQLSVEEQHAQLEKLAPELLEKKQKEERDIFEFLGCKEGVRTAFPPGPEKFPHIGHAKAILLNYLLAKQYHGKFILRFEDTNPTTVKQEYYAAMLDNFAWLGVSWDELLYASDFMELFYEKCEELLRKGLAYIDTAPQEEIALSREKGVPTSSHAHSIQQNLQLWKEMPKMNAGSAIVRLKIDLKHQNSTMRDPTIFRLVDEPHARQGTKYRIWPNYDFQNAIMDAHSNIDMRIRSKEFEMRTELQRWIQEQLGIKITKTYEFGRFNMTGVESSGRVIREKVQKGELVGWDDPSLTTLVALRRRGFVPEAIKNFVLSTGISKAEATMAWDDLIVQNKKVIDPIARRYSAVFDGVTVEVKGAPAIKGELNLHPDEKKGGRPFDTHGKFILAKKDIDAMEEGEIVRLMDCLNMKKEKGQLVFHSKSFDEFKGNGKRVINWLPEKDNVEIEVLTPEKELLKGVAEKNILNVKVNEVIQLERFAFCRLDKKEKEKLCFWFTHK
ncbi:MAG: glutamate--tRNA ligase [Nanoarchaeota archaeon]|nr:glutamate--tRNA ligase [Nanoarchaeota archaeon]